jgi:D-psicose/D-tagatose/L-ribulose 3-epimerase
MNVGANLWIWESPVTLPVIERYAPKLAGWGFDLVELPLEAADSWDAVAVDAVLKSQGLRATVCVAMSPDRDLTTNDAATVGRTTDYLRAAIEAAERVGSPVIAGPIYAPTGRTGALTADARREMLLRLAHNLAPLLDAAEDAGVRLAIEPLNRFETSLFNTTAQLMDFIDRVDHPQIGVLLDTFHMNIEERDMAAAIRAAGDRLAHFHASGNDRGAPRPGAMPWLAIRDALHEIPYDGALVIESFTADNQTIAKAASIWRRLEPTQDDIAVEGLATLRTVFGD